MLAAMLDSLIQEGLLLMGSGILGLGSWVGWDFGSDTIFVAGS